MEIEEAKVFLDNLKTCINEHPIVADWLVEIADRKTEPTCSKMEQVDRDINVRSKDELQTCSVNGRPYDCGNCEYFRCTADEPQTEDFQDWKDRMWAEAVIEPQTGCNGCKFVGTYDTEFPCANCSRKTKDYYAKDEPQRDCESCKYFGHDEIEACGYCRHKDLYEPQTERSSE